MEGIALRGPAERGTGGEGKWQRLEQRRRLRSPGRPALEEKGEVYSQDCKITITDQIGARGYNNKE